MYLRPLARQRRGVFLMRACVLIDGGHARALVQSANRTYNPDYIEKIAHACVDSDETLLRVLYYDCAPYIGKARQPVSGTIHEFKGSDAWLRDLAQRDLFAVRRGVLKFRGFKPRTIPIGKTKLKDSDFKPDFEQKGVDMRIGLDIANYAILKTVDRIILVSGDTDCLPAMKLARIHGIQVVLASLPNHKVAPELLWHCDYERRIAWPAK